MSDAVEKVESYDDPVLQSYIAYSAFIGQIQLERIWLKSTRVTNSVGGETPPNSEVTLDDVRTWKDSEDGFQAFHKYIVEFKNDRNRKLARIEVEFGLDYHSDEPMTEDIFALFAVNNLPLNSWPYLREYLANTVSRMNWLPFTLPALKFPADAPPDELGEVEESR